jgi:hypothetical protein
MMQANANGSWSIPRHLGVVMGLVVVATAVRGFQLGEPSMWNDELYTMRSCMELPGWSKALGYLPHRLGLQLQGIDISAALASQPERWRDSGIDEMAARLPACLIGIITIPLFYVIGCRVFGPQASFMASALLALSLWHVIWSQTARFYALQLLFGSVSLLLYLRWWQTQRRLTAIGSLAALALAVLSQPTAIVLFGVYIIDSLVRAFRTGDSRVVRRVIIGLIVPAVIVGIALAVDVTRHPRRWTQFFDRTTQSPAQLGFSFIYMVGPAIILTGLCSAWVAIKERHPLGIALVIAALLPWIAYAAAGMVVMVWVRYCIVALPAWLCLSAMICSGQFGATKKAAEWAGPLIFVALIGSQCVPLGDYFLAGQLRPQTREAVAYVKSVRRPGEPIFMDEIEGAYYFEEPMAGNAQAAAHDSTLEMLPAWLVYRHDWRGSKPAREGDWVGLHTEPRAVFGDNGIGIYGIGWLARTHVRYMQSTID